MQPYTFAYVPYFQLVGWADTFVIYDDVNFIKRGWINRNNILVNGEPSLFSIPLIKASQNRLINEIELSDFGAWRDKFTRSLHLAYGKAPHFSVTMEVIEGCIGQDHRTIADLAESTIRTVSGHLGFDTQFVRSSEVDHDRSLGGQDRILAICKELGAEVYVNPINGRELYDQDTFEEAGIGLFFIESHVTPYQQGDISIFVPHLSIIDSLMFNTNEELNAMMQQYKLVK